MGTTINVDDDLFDQILVLTAARRKTEAVRRAVTDYVRLGRKERLLAIRGTLEVSGHWHELRDLERAEVADA